MTNTTEKSKTGRDNRVSPGSDLQFQRGWLRRPRVRGVEYVWEESGSGLGVSDKRNSQEAKRTETGMG